MELLNNINNRPESKTEVMKKTFATSWPVKIKLILSGLAGLVVWYAVYRQLLPFSQYLTYTVFGLTPESHLGEAVEFFVYDTPKVLMLLTLVVFGVGIIRTFFTPERTRGHAGR